MYFHSAVRSTGWVAPIRSQCNFFSEREASQFRYAQLLGLDTMGLFAVAQLVVIASIAFAVYRRWKQYLQHRVWMILRRAFLA